MKNIKLDTILLFALLIPFIMTYRISPGTTPYWLFGLIFFGLLSYISLDLFFDIKDNLRSKLKMLALWSLIIFSIGSGIFSEIIVRHQTAPIYGVHDIILQQESAIRFLIHGINPYSTTYFGTPLEQWHYSDTQINPALYHFVMQPFYLLFAIPFYFLCVHTIGFFDGRIPLFFLFVSLLVMTWKLIINEDRKREFIIFLAFNPATLGYLMEGRDDIFMFAFLFLSLFLLHRNKHSWSGIFMGLAFAIKQSVWPIFPFYLGYLYFKNKNFKKTFLELVPFSLTFIIIVLPFFIWNQKAFLDSTIFYLSGNIAHSYPVSGYGFGKLLEGLNIIKDVNSYYPFIIWQIVLGLPLLIALIKWQEKNNSISKLILAYGIFLFVFWYFSRYFNNSHLGYLSMVFITAYFWSKNEKTT